MHALHKRYLPCLSIDVIVGSTQTSPTFMSFQSELKIGLQHCGRQSCGGEQYIRLLPGSTPQPHKQAVVCHPGRAIPLSLFGRKPMALQKTVTPKSHMSSLCRAAVVRQRRSNRHDCYRDDHNVGISS